MTPVGIWEQVHKGLRAFILKRVRNDVEADDILQEVFLRVHRRLDGLKDPERMVSWVFQITRHVIIDYARSVERRREVSAGLTVDMEENDPASDERATMSDEVRTELSGCLRPMLDRLPLKYREAINLVELDGLTNQEAASRLGISVAGMKSRVQRGRRQLKHMLNDCCLIELDSRKGVATYELSNPDSCQRSRCAEAD